jgi:hypothetical protein
MSQWVVLEERGKEAVRRCGGADEVMRVMVSGELVEVDACTWRKRWARQDYGGPGRVLYLNCQKPVRVEEGAVV